MGDIKMQMDEKTVIRLGILLEQGFTVSYNSNTHGIFIHSRNDVSGEDIKRVLDILKMYCLSGVKNCGECVVLFFEPVSGA